MGQLGLADGVSNAKEFVRKFREKAVTLDSQILEATVDTDIAAFSEYFQRVLKNDEPLSKSERAILKTYLWWKTHPEKHDAEQASSSEHV